MPRYMRPEQFPPQYFTIAEEVGNQNKVIHVPIATLTEGHKLRGHFYLFKGCVRALADKALEKHPDQYTPTDRQMLDLRQKLDKVSFWVDKDTTTAKFINRDQSFYGRLLAGARLEEGAPLVNSEMNMLEEAAVRTALQAGTIDPSALPPKFQHLAKPEAAEEQARASGNAPLPYPGRPSPTKEGNE